MAKNTTDGATSDVTEEKTADPAPADAPAAETAAAAAEPASEPDHPNARRDAFLGKIEALKSRAMLASRRHDLQGLAAVVHEFFDLVADQAPRS